MKVGLINWNWVYCPATYFHTMIIIIQYVQQTLQSQIQIFPLDKMESERKKTRSVGDILATQGEHVIIGQGISVAA